MTGPVPKSVVSRCRSSSWRRAGGRGCWAAACLAMATRTPRWRPPCSAGARPSRPLPCAAGDLETFHFGSRQITVAVASAAGTHYATLFRCPCCCDCCGIAAVIAVAGAKPSSDVPADSRQLAQRLYQLLHSKPQLSITCPGVGSSQQLAPVKCQTSTCFSGSRQALSQQPCQILRSPSRFFRRLVTDSRSQHRR